jgi:hypothetical protein
MREIGPVESALLLVKQGFRVFPLHTAMEGACSCFLGPDCKQKGKHPVFPGGFYRAGKSMFSVFQQWSTVEHSNVGLRTGDGLGILDVDVGKGGWESLVELAERYGKLPPSWSVRTGSGGLHVYFRIAQPVPNSVGRIAPGIDFRGDGGYVVAPGSRHACGGDYQWTHGQTPRDIPLADIPSWLLELALPKPGLVDDTVFELPDGELLKGGDVIIANRPEAMARKILQRQCEKMAQTQEGGRNDRLFRCAFRVGRLVGGGALGIAEAREAVHMAALATGLEDKEITATANNGFKRGIALPQRILTPDQVNTVPQNTPAIAIDTPLIADTVNPTDDETLSPASSAASLDPQVDALYGAFKTSKGSIYHLDSENRTMRDKAARDEHPGESGPQPVSSLTFYVEADLAAAFTPPVESEWIVFAHDEGTFSLATRNADGRWGAAPESRRLTVSSRPALGLCPVELWQPDPTTRIPAGLAYRALHVGNPIVRIFPVQRTALDASSQEDADSAEDIDRYIRRQPDPGFG